MNVPSCPVPRALACPVPRALACPVPRALACPVPRALACPVPRALACPVPRALAYPVPRALAYPVPRALALMIVLAALVGLAACSENSPNNCACTVTIGADSLTLGCGESGCLTGSRFGCAEDLVMPLGRCDADLGTGAVDNGDGGQCLPPAASCEGASLSCCGVASDAGVLSPSCDPVSRRCCVATGASCESSADCCAGHACTLVGNERRCGN